MSLKSNLQLYLLQKIKKLKIESNQLESLFHFSCLIECFLNNSTETQQDDYRKEVLSELKDYFSLYSLNDVKNEFKNSFYSICLNEIIGNLDAANKSSSSQHSFQEIKNSILTIIHSTNYCDSFNVIYDYCVNLKTSQHKDFCLYLMKFYLSKHLVKELLLEKTFYENSNRNILIEDDLTKKLFNLPDKFANVYNKNLNSIFIPSVYFKIIISDLWLCLKEINSKKQFKQHSLDFVSVIFGKLSFLGYSDVLFNSLIKNLISCCYQDENWRKVSNCLFNKIPCKYLENSLLNIIKNSSSFKDIEILMGDLAMTNTNIQYFLKDKFIFLKILNKEIAIQNLIGYLYSAESRRPLYYELFKNLLSTWSNQASIINTSYEQHLYLTKCIVVCEAFMDEKDKNVLADELMRMLLKGVEKHLHSPIDKVRTLGMVVGENLMNDLNRYENEKSDCKKLKFEYEVTEDIKLLQSLKRKPPNESLYNKSNNIDNELAANFESFDLKRDQNEKVLFTNKNLKLKITQDEEDSDDDLIPYDTSNDVPLSTNKQPAYLRDCLDALIYSDDPEKIEMSIKSVEKLCDSFHFELQEICVELLKVLLHKSNQYAIENFDDIKMTAMISVTVHYPKESAEYLTTQFYEAGYTLTQRTDILHVLVVSIQKLSSPNENPIFDRRLFVNSNETFSNLIPFNKSNKTENSWREIVEKRIAEKTKIKKSSTKTKTVIKTKENKYSDIYGHFFFPLLRPYDKNRVHLNIIEQDFMLLGKLVFSLGVILFSSVNTIVLENMVIALTDFLWVIKSHAEPYVRKSVLFSFTLILLVIPNDTLFATLNNYFVELKYWLEEVMMNDSNMECQKKAFECLNILGQRVKGQLK